MRLERYAARGFCHFSQPFALDLTALPAGLIAVVGPNGAGKTSLVLDSPIASLYGPGRAKAFPSRDGTLQTYATERDAYLDTVWSLNGRGRFRVRVNIDGIKRKTDAVLEEIGADGRHHPVNDGKVETFMVAVQERFPSLRSLLASAYAAQNKRGGFGELSQRERMELFVELADLAHYEEKSQTAKRCAQAADQVVVELRASLDAVRRDATPEAVRVVEERISALEVEIGQASTRCGELNDRRSLLLKERAFAADLAERYITAAQEFKALEDQEAVNAERVARAGMDLTAAVTAHIQALQASDGRLAAVHQSIQQRRDQLLADFARGHEERQRRITTNRDLLARAEETHRAVAEVARCDAEEARLKERVTLLEQARDEATAQYRTRDKQLRIVNAAVLDLADAQRRSAMLATVKFGEPCAEDPACPLVLDAVAARTRIADLEGLASTKETLDAGVRHWLREEAVAINQLTAARTEITRLADLRAGLKAQAAQASYLDAAQARIDEYESDGQAAVRALDAAKQALLTEVDQAMVQHAREQEAAQQALTGRRQQLEADIAALECAAREVRTRLAALRHEVDQLSGAKVQLDGLNAELETLASAIADVRLKQARSEADLVQATAQRDTLQARLVESADLALKLRIAEDHRLAWHFLSDACGKNGLQRLEIDAAGPVVSDLANQLLQVGYGTRFSVDIVTQVATADGKDLKERFTILAIDNQHGGEPRDIGDLSGGEKVIVEEAIRAALACYVNLRSRHRFRTLFRDETTGALDPEHAPQYVAMLRKLVEVSGADQCLFITHSPECAALADAQVRVANGQATVALPPYGA